MLCKNWTAPQPNERGTSGKWKWKPNAQHPSLHWMCLYIIIFCSLFFCIFKVEHNTCVAPDTEQPGCGKHFPLKFFLAKRYVRDTLLLSLHFFLYFSLSFCFFFRLPSHSRCFSRLSCVVFIKYSWYSMSPFFTALSFELELFQVLNFMKIEMYPLGFLLGTSWKVCPMEFSLLSDKQFSWKTFSPDFLMSILPLFPVWIAFQSRALCLSCGKLNRFYLKVCLNWRRSSWSKDDV